MNTLEHLRLYIARVEELNSTRLIKNGFNPGITIRWERMQGLQFESREPDEEHLRSFLLTFRQFISSQEPVYLNRIYNLSQQHLTSDTLKGYLVQSREIWKRAQRSTGIQITINSTEFTPEYVTDLWINGYYFHNDNEKMAKLKNLLPHDAMLVRNQFLNSLVDATRQVLYVGNIITVALHDNMFRVAT